MTDYPQQPEIKKYKQKALDSCNLMIANSLLGASIVSGVGVAYLVGKTFGFIAGGIIFFVGLDSSRKEGNKEEIIEKYELYAPFLDRSDLIEYKDLVGAKQIENEIEKARELGVSPKAAAENWLFSYEKNTPSFSPNLQEMEPVEVEDKDKNESLIEDNTGNTEDSTEDNTDNINNINNTDNIEDNNIDENNPFFPNNIVSSQLLIFSGSQGSGKTTRAARVIELKIELLNAFVIVCNPFSKASEWHGIPVAGRGVDINGNLQKMSDYDSYSDVEYALNWFVKICEGRSQKQRSDENYNPMEDKHICLVLEEVTDWGSHISKEIMRAFWQKTMRTLRQLNLSVVLVTHSVTADGLGGKESTSGYIETILRQSEYFIFNSITNKNIKNGESPKIPSKEARWKPANIDSKKGDNFEKIIVPSTFRPKNKNLDFRFLTDLEKFPNWQILAGLKKSSTK